MPAAIKLQEEYGDDLAVIFVESQGTSVEKTASFILDRRWMGASTMWTNERPFDTGSRGLPNFALISSDGKVLAKGTGGLTSRDKDLIADEIKASKGAPADSNKAFKSAWKDFSKGKIAKAIEGAEKVGAKKPELAAEATAVVEEFEARIQSRLDAISWSIDNGYAFEAKGELKDLLKSLKGADGMYTSAQEIEQRFTEEGMELELEASEVLGKALAKLFEDGREEKLFDKVEKLSDKYAGTKVAARARKVVAMRP